MTDTKALANEIEDMAELLYERLLNAQVKGMTATLKLKFSDFQIVTRSITVEYPISAINDIKQLSIHLLDKIDLIKPVRLLGIGVSNFLEGEEVNSPQLSLALS